MSKRNVPYAHLILFSDKLLAQLKRSSSDEVHVKSLEAILAKKVKTKTKLTLKDYDEEDRKVIQIVGCKRKRDKEILAVYLNELRSLVLSLPTDSYRKWKNNCRKLASNKNGKTIFVDNDTLNLISSLVNQLGEDGSSNETLEFNPKVADRVNFKKAMNKIFIHMSQNKAELKKLKSLE